METAHRARLKCVQCGYEAEVTARKDLTVGKMIPALCPDCQGNMVVIKDMSARRYSIPLDRVASVVGANFPVFRAEEGFNYVRIEVGAPYRETSFAETMKGLEPLGLLPIVRRFGRTDIMTVFPRVREEPQRLRTNLVLLGLTFVSTFFAGLYLTGFFFGAAYFEVAKWDALFYSIGIMAILGFHEMGHKLASMKYKVEATYPYFIPVPWPFILGTMGAIIKMKGSLPDRNAMLRIGAAGPICGFLVTIPVTLIGLSLSTPEVAVSQGGPNIFIGASPLFRILRDMVVPGEYGLTLHPLAIAGWAGMLVTMLNLFPAGMLDGGHVSRAVFGMRIHKSLGYVTGLTLLALFFFQQFKGASFAGWLLWGLLALFFARVGHPGSLDESGKLTKTSWALGLSVLLIFGLTAIPLPIRVVDVPKIYISSLTAHAISATTDNRTYMIRCRVQNEARTAKVRGIQARILLPINATLSPGSNQTITLDSMLNTAEFRWNVTVTVRQRILDVYCLVDSANAGSDEARVRFP